MRRRSSQGQPAFRGVRQARRPSHVRAVRVLLRKNEHRFDPLATNMPSTGRLTPSGRGTARSCSILPGWLPAKAASTGIKLPRECHLSRKRAAPVRRGKERPIRHRRSRATFPLSAGWTWRPGSSAVTYPPLEWSGPLPAEGRRDERFFRAETGRRIPWTQVHPDPSGKPAPSGVGRAASVSTVRQGGVS